MKKYATAVFGLFLFLVTQTDAGVFDRTGILAIMRQVADRTPYNGTTWDSATFWPGILALYDITQNQKYLNAALNWGSSHQWKAPTDYYNADNLNCGQSYAELYLLDPVPANAGRIADMNSAYTYLANLGTSGRSIWWWCDALFMAPPTMARICRIKGTSGCFDHFNTWWWDVNTNLYDSTEGFYFRDNSFFYPAHQTSHGKKIFWSRGNGWVLAGTARVLEYLPDNYPDRQKYVRLLQRMAASLKAVQGSDGLWRSSLLDSAQYPTPETSGTAFFCYGLAWGVRHGYLDSAAYLPAVRKAWQGLCGKVDATGKLGYVQIIASAPGETYAADTKPYAAGGFLLAGREMYLGNWGDGTTGIAGKTKVTVEEIQLEAKPNPFTMQTTFSVSAGRNESGVNLDIYDVRGKLIKSLVPERCTPYAVHRTLSWSPAGLPSGIYLAKLSVGNKTITKQLFLMK